LLYYLADEGGDFLLSPEAGLAIVAALIVIVAVVAVVFAWRGTRKRGYAVQEIIAELPAWGLYAEDGHLLR
jgi:hypothetical protein